MSDLPPASMEWLAGHPGVITTRVLTTHGVGRSARDRLVAAGVLTFAAKGVLVIASSPDTLERRCAVLCGAHPDGFITGPTAGQLAGLRRMPRSSALHLAVRHGRHLPRTAGVTWRQTTVATRADRDERDGITVASWTRLAFDLAADLRRLDHLSVVNELLHQRRVTLEGLAAIDRRLGHPGRPGSGRFRQTLLAVGDVPNESHAEVVVADALRRRGVPVQHQALVVRAANGRSYHVDLAVPAARWGVELDIHPEHRSWEGQAADAGRRRDLHRLAWQIETVTEHDMNAVERLADELADLYRRRIAGSSHPSAS